MAATAGFTRCNPFFSAAQAAITPSNCVVTGPNPNPPPATTSVPGTKLPFGGIYGDALNRLFSFTYYSYAVVLNFEQPLMNDARVSTTPPPVSA